MERDRAKYNCSLCGVKFLFENTLLLHNQNIHKNSNLNLQLRTMESQVQERIGGEISITLAAPALSPVVSSPPFRVEMLQVKPQPGRRSSGERCPQCSFSSRNPILLLEHRSLEHRAKPIPVFYCGYSTCWFPFSSKRRRDEHEKMEHGHLAPSPFFCKICKKRFSQWGNSQKKHYEQCSKRVLYRCPSGPGCQHTTRRYADLRRHMEAIHGDVLARYRKDQYEVRAGIQEVKEEKIEVKFKSESELRQLKQPEEYYEEEDKEEKRLAGIAEVSAALEGHLCPFDQRRFNTASQLHLHLHNTHLDTGTDSLDCPLGQDSLTCFCGRRTNCRHSLVAHVSRCELNNTADGLRSSSVVVEDNTEARSLATQRRAARRLKELGIKKQTTEQERLRRDQMMACEQIIGLDQEVGQQTEEVEDDPDSEEEEEEDDDTKVDLTVLAPVKRKSYGAVGVSQVTGKKQKRGD